jgi:hypothetical protein
VLFNRITTFGIIGYLEGSEDYYLTDRSEVELLWDAVLGDTAWTDVLQAISASTNGSSVCLLQAQSNLSFDFWFHNFDPGVDPELLGGMMDPAHNPIATALNRAPVGLAFDRRSVVPDAIYNDGPAFEHFRRQDVIHGQICKLAGASVRARPSGWGCPETVPMNAPGLRRGSRLGRRF